MYSLSVLAMFKNEADIIHSWIDHYLAEGVEHFYLINNGSTDESNKKVSRYARYVTVINDARRTSPNPQTYLLNHIYLNKIKNETEWIIICDMDEYIYARNKYVQIMDVLKKIPPNVEKIWIPWKCFGSNGHVEQPKDVIRSFTKRQADISIQMDHGKVICRTQNLINIIDAGHAVELSHNNVYYLCNGQRLDLCKSNDPVFNALHLHLNHYMLMSEEYYKNIKCVRGGGETGHTTNKFTMASFHTMNETMNEVNDIELAKKTYTCNTQMSKT
jgi:hypothetical protein